VSVAPNVKMIGIYTMKNVLRHAHLDSLESVKKEYVKNVMSLVRYVVIILPQIVNTVLKVFTLMDPVVLKLKIVEKELMLKMLLENAQLAQFLSVQHAWISILAMFV
jgi:hypothetical protein